MYTCNWNVIFTQVSPIGNYVWYVHLCIKMEYNVNKRYAGQSHPCAGPDSFLHRATRIWKFQTQFSSIFYSQVTTLANICMVTYKCITNYLYVLWCNSSLDIKQGKYTSHFYQKIIFKPWPWKTILYCFVRNLRLFQTSRINFGNLRHFHDFKNSTRTLRKRSFLKTKYVHV